MIKLIKSPFFNEKDTKKQLAKFVKDTEIFSMNKQCANFEKAFSEKQQRKYSAFVGSGSAANLVLIQAALNLGLVNKGDKVGISALTWSTNVMPIIQLGLIPVPIDCSIKTLNVSPETLQKHVKEIKALFLTNVLGFSDNIKEISAICKKNNILFLEDNCESLGSAVKGKLLGNFGKASTFSFFIGHHMSTIEGGMICTDDKKLYEMLVLVRAHGWSRNLDAKTQESLRKKHKISSFFDKYTFYDLAVNARPCEINGFIGNLQIKHWDQIVKAREKNWRIFNSAIDNNDDFIKLDFSHMSIVSNFAVPVICKSEKLFEKYKKRFSDNNVEIRPIIAGNISKQPFFKKYVKSVPSCPNADIAHENGFYFGNNPDLTKKEIKFMCSLLSNK